MAKRYVLEEDTPTTGRYVIEDAAPQPGFGAKLDSELSKVPRQLGLTVRHGVGSLADFAGIAYNPLAATLNTLGMNIPRLQTTTDNLLDMAGVPKPETPRERVVGDATRVLGAGGGMIKGVQLASKAVPAIARFAERAGTQAASAIGAGGAGGYTRETGGGPGAQFVAALGGGLAAPAVLSGATTAANRVAGAARNLVGSKPANINITINNALESAGYKPTDLPKRVMNQIEADVAAASQQGNLSQDAVRRLVDYRLVGATPLRGNLTLNPVDLTRQHNLSKTGANSSIPALQSLAERQNTNTGTLLRNLNELGANTTDDAYAAGQKVMGGLGRTAYARQGEINAAYTNARNQTGLDAQIDPYAFTQRAGDLLKTNLLEGALPADVRNILNNAATGKMPLTVSTAEQIKTAIGNLQRTTADGSTRKALGLVRQALDEAPITGGQGGDAAVEAFTAARALNRNWRSLVEKTPALQAIEEGVQPDRFVMDYVIRGGNKGNLMDVARLKNAIKDSPEALQAVRGQILAHLKSKATSGKPDEAMTFSQSGYNNALSSIGERKLRMFFTKPEIDQMKAVGRVAMYEQIQPSGSAVNNSNTAAMAVANIFDWIAGNKMVNALPFGQAAISGPANSISTTLQASGVANVPNALIAPAARAQRTPPLPLLMVPGLLGDRRKDN